MLIGAGIGAATDIGFQLLMNGGNWDRLDPWQVGESATLGALGGGLGSLTRIARQGAEFSHAIPSRYLRPRSLSGQSVNPEYKPHLDAPIVRAFIKSSLNGNYVSPKTDALTDPHRYLKGMTKADKLNPALQKILRTPGHLAGSAAGSAAGVANSAMNSNDCGCN